MTPRPGRSTATDRNPLALADFPAACGRNRIDLLKLCSFFILSIEHEGSGVMPINGEVFEPDSYAEAVRVLAESADALPAVVEDLLQPELGVWVRSLGTKPFDLPRMTGALRGAIEEKVRNAGLSREEAALYLGMKLSSFADLLAQRPPNLRVRLNSEGEERFLKDELDAFMDEYLPRFKTWSSRTSLLSDLFQSLEQRMGFSASAQQCEIEGCGNFAEVACANPDCRAGGPTRKVCAAHRERLRESGGSLCAACVHRVLYGDLQSRYSIAGTEARLLRDHPA